MDTPAVTICVLTYGDYPELAYRAIESIRKHLKRSDYCLIVGANAVCDETRKYLENLKSEGAIDHLIQSEQNINKCPMMKMMISYLNTELLWWFDDDSYVTEDNALERWLTASKNSSQDTVMWGHVFFFGDANDFNYGIDVISFVKRALWYNGKTPPSWEIGGKGIFQFDGKASGDGRWFFATGGCWMIRSFAIEKLKWPDPRLVKRNDDVFLAEAIRQQGWLVEDVGEMGVAINRSPRRGEGEDAHTMFIQMNVDGE